MSFHIFYEEGWKMMKRWGLFFLILAFAMGSFLSTNLQAAPVKLKAVTAWPVGFASVDKFREWVKIVNEKGKNIVEVDILGGPEVTPMPEQFGALKRGVFDLNLSAAGYYMGTVPEAEAFGLSRISPPEERQIGFYDLEDKIHEKHGIKYVGRTMGLVPLGVLCVNKKIERPQELKGMKIRTVIIYDAFMRELGAVPVTIPEPEIYTSLERGVVDGFVAPLASGFTKQGFHEVVKYIIKPYFYQIPTVLLANGKSWDKLPDDARKILVDSIKQIESTTVDYYRNIHETELKKAQELGVKVIEFSPEDAKWFVDTAYRVSWDNLAKKAPANVEQLRKLSVK